MSSHDNLIGSSAPTNNDSESQNETRTRRLSMLLPLLLNLASQNQIPHQESESESGPEINTDSRTRFTVIMVDRRTGAMLVMEGTGDIDNLFEHLSSKSGVSPASKASIDAMPRVVIHEAGAECAICLETYEIESEAREMPCKHRFHSGCIEKWLGVHGSCPMCRFMMPAEKTDSNAGGGSEGGEDGDESREEVVSLRLWVRDETSESSDPMDVDVESGLGARAVDLDLNRREEDPYEYDAADDSTSTTPETNLE